MKAIIVFIAVFIFLFYSQFVKSVFAVSVTISDYPSTITEDSFTITASVSGATAGTNYLRIDLFKDGTTNYFGETFNNSDWYGGSTYSQYLPITIQSGVTWSGNVQGRIGSPTATQYDGSGTYKMRLRRYTGGGGYTSSEASNSAVLVSIVMPTATPVPTSTPTPTNTPTPSPTSSPTNTPTPTKTPTPTPTPNTPTSKSTTPSTPANAIPTSILGASTENDPIFNQTKKPDTIFNWIAMALGIIFIAACVIFILRVIKKGELDKNEEE